MTASGPQSSNGRTIASAAARSSRAGPAASRRLGVSPADAAVAVKLRVTASRVAASGATPDSAASRSLRSSRHSPSGFAAPMSPATAASHPSIGAPVASVRLSAAGAPPPAAAKASTIAARAASLGASPASRLVPSAPRSAVST